MISLVTSLISLLHLDQVGDGYDHIDDFHKTTGDDFYQQLFGEVFDHMVFDEFDIDNNVFDLASLYISI